MFLLVRDEDGPTVASAINAFADEEGLEPIDISANAQNPLAMLSVLTGPRAVVTQAEGVVAVFGLESLDIADAEDWGAAMSAACETEVLALEVEPEGVRVHVYDGGEPDEVIEMPLDPSGRTRSGALADFTDLEEGHRELAEGIVAGTPTELAMGILRCFGVGAPGPEAIMLSFVDPLDDEEAETEPHLEVLPLAGAPSPTGFTQMFSVTLRGTDAVEGLRLELSGTALDLASIESVEVVHRVRGSHERVTRQAERPEGTTFVVDDAYLERVDQPPPAFDLTDMFATMQRLVSSGETQQLNTVLVSVRATKKRSGQGELTLTAEAPAADVTGGEATIDVEL